MPNTETSRTEFARIVDANVFAHDLTYREAVLRILPDWLVFVDCADGSVDLVDAETPEWAREIYYNLPSVDKRDIERGAWESIQKRREP